MAISGGSATNSVLLDEERIKLESARVEPKESAELAGVAHELKQKSDSSCQRRGVAHNRAPRGDTIMIQEILQAERFKQRLRDSLVNKTLNFHAIKIVCETRFSRGNKLQSD
jgi:hypothetical protein